MIHDLWLVLTGKLSMTSLKDMKRAKDIYRAEVNRYSELYYQNARLANEARERQGELVKSLHDMDQLAFNISQCTDFASMRPYIQQLCKFAASRQQDESKRIRDLLVPEIKATYGKGGPGEHGPLLTNDQRRLK